MSGNDAQIYKNKLGQYFRCCFHVFGNFGWLTFYIFVPMFAKSKSSLINVKNLRYDMKRRKGDDGMK